MSIFELRRKKDLILLGSTDLYTFARLHANLDESANLDECECWDESFPIIEFIIHRLGFDLIIHESIGVCVSSYKGKINIKDFKY